MAAFRVEVTHFSCQSRTGLKEPVLDKAPSAACSRRRGKRRRQTLKTLFFLLYLICLQPRALDLNSPAAFQVQVS